MAGVRPYRSMRWESLYERHAAGSLRLAFLLIGDRELAQDIVQEAFVRCFGRFTDLRTTDAFGGYLRRTVINLSKDHWRRLEHQRRYLRTAARDLDHPDPAAGVAARDEIWRALLTLPHVQRATIVLRFYEDLTEQQIADAMRCSTGAVKSRLSRGISVLRARMEERGA